MAKLRVFMPSELGVEQRQYFLSLLRTDVDVQFERTQAEGLAYEVLVSGRPSRQDLEGSTALHSLVIPYAGLPETTRTLLRAFPQVKVFNLHHNAVGTAEMAMALMLAAVKRVLPLDRALREGDWSRRYQGSSAFLLRGKRALILGFGAIGKRIAGYCQAFGMHVVAVKKHVNPCADFRSVALHPPTDLIALLPTADLIFVCLPLTEETEGLLGEEELGLLPNHAVLVNVARGPIVDERALYQALKQDRLGAAGLDVWYQYPQSQTGRKSTMPASQPFHTLDQVVMTPHIAGGWNEVETERMSHLAALLNAMAKGEKIESRIDLDAGY